MRKITQAALRFMLLWLATPWGCSRCVVTCSMKLDKGGIIRFICKSLITHEYCYSDPQILVLNRATNLNARMNDGTTPLILAVRLAVENMVEDLITAEADINATDKYSK